LTSSTLRQKEKTKSSELLFKGFKEPSDGIIPENMKTLEAVFETIIPPEHWFSGYCDLIISGNATEEDHQYDEVNSHMYALGHLASKPKESPTKKPKKHQERKRQSQCPKHQPQQAVVYITVGKARPVQSIMVSKG
jgi:hypothetical protein